MRVKSGLAALAGAVVACAVAAVWIPVRESQSNVIVALALVVVTGAMGATGKRAGVVGAAVSAGVWFTVFDTQPYDRFAISRQPDVATAVCLVAVGLVIGELVVRLARQRRAEHDAGGGLRRVRQAATRLALGEELVVMIGAVADDLSRLLHLDDCWFCAEPLLPVVPTILREGRLSEPLNGADAALPVWGLGQVVGHFVLRGGRVAWTRDELLVAVTLADQVGAALSAQAPPGPETAGDSPAPNLRVVH